LKLPLEFINNIEGGFGEAGKYFLANLPAAIEEASQRWGLTNVQPVPTLSYNFVTFADRGDEQVVLKMGVPDRELKSEMAALRLFNGEGACYLIDCDEEKYWMLLERLKPGVMLLTLEDDEEATHIAAEVMQKIWRPLESLESASSLAQKQASGLQSFIRLSDWFGGLERLHATFNGGTGPFNERLVERAERSAKDFFTENHQPVLMHGDFHHFNILSSERGWLVIDPKGVMGPACYEVGPFLLNPWLDFLSRSDCRQITQRRIAILHEHLGFEPERIREWGTAHAILSSWWSYESHSDWQHAANFAEMIADLPLGS
jgi:streptomycin 6-kinase